MIIYGKIISPGSEHNKNVRWIWIVKNKIKKIYKERPTIDDSVINSNFILPGLINAHIHYFNRDDSVLFESGITTLRDMGMPLVTLRLLQEVLPKDGVTRILSGPIFTVKNGYPLNFNDGRMGIAVNELEDIESKVNMVFDYGAHYLKLALTKGDDKKWPMLKASQIESIVRLARLRRRNAVAHINSVADLMFGFESGIRDFAHFPSVDLLQYSQIQKLVRKNVSICSTATSLKNLSEINNSYREANSIYCANILNFYREGGQITVGNDFGTGIVSSPALFEEMEYLGEIIKDNESVLKFVTLNNAKVCRLQNRVGTIEENKDADMILLNSDPLEDLRNIRDISMVIKRGNIVFRKYSKEVDFNLGENLHHINLSSC